MRGIVEKTGNLNERVRLNIDKQLFLFCNYASTGFVWIGDDAKYINGVLELYNIVKDTNFVFSKIRYILCGEEHGNGSKILQERWYKELKETIILINIFRSVHAHNINRSNGFIEKKEVIEYEAWVEKVIGKKIPETKEDYEVLLSAIEEISIICEKLTNSFLTYVEKASDKEEIVSRWKKVVLETYKKKRDVFYGQLGDFYEALCKRDSITYSYIKDRTTLVYKLNCWIKNYYMQPFTNEINKYNQLYIMVSKKITKSSLKEMERNIDAKKKEVQAEKEKLYEKIREKCNINISEELSINVYADYFFECTLPQMMQDAIQQEQCNLLPQNIFQEIIKKHFLEITYDRLI